MTTIELNATTLRVSEMPEDSFHWLRAHYSYVPPNQPVAFDETGRPLRIQLVSEDGVCSIGLLRGVIDCLRQTETPVRIIDNRPNYKPEHPWKFAGELRDYQEPSVQAMLRNRCGFLQSPPRAGKTVMLAAAIARAGLSPTVVLSGTTVLAMQTAQVLQRLIPNAHVGVVGGGTFEVGQITSCTYQSVYRALGVTYDGEEDPLDREELPPTNYEQLKTIWQQAKFVAVDEGRVVESPSLQRILAYAYSAMYRIGLDATPWASSPELDVLLEATVGPVFYRISYDVLFREGYLIPPDIYFLHLPPQSIFVDEPTWSTVYKELIVENEQRNEMIVEFANRMNAQGRSVFIPVSQVKHGNILKREIPDSIFMKSLPGNSANYYIDVLDALRRKDTLTLISTIPAAGMDIPSLDAVVVADAFSDSRRNLQRMRQITAYPGKTQALHVDFFDEGPWINDHSTDRLRQYKKYSSFRIHLPEDSTGWEDLLRAVEAT